MTPLWISMLVHTLIYVGTVQLKIVMSTTNQTSIPTCTGIINNGSVSKTHHLLILSSNSCSIPELRLSKLLTLPRINLRDSSDRTVFSWALLAERTACRKSLSNNVRPFTKLKRRKKTITRNFSRKIHMWGQKWKICSLRAVTHKYTHHCLVILKSGWQQPAVDLTTQFTSEPGNGPPLQYGPVLIGVGQSENSSLFNLRSYL